MKASLFILALYALVVSPFLQADTAVVPAAQDATLYETADVSTEAANGAGDYLFTGVTKNGLARRAILSFDIASVIPVGATIEQVQLQLTVSRVPNPSNPTNVSLHRVSAAWGEGASHASGEEGAGQTPPAEGDVSWRFRFFDEHMWVSNGGDFAALASATVLVSDEGTYTWGSSPEMVADVQSWLDQPETDFGWLVIADESDSKNAKRFNSRENLAAVSAELTISYSTASPVGACCTGSACQLLSETECLLADGEFGGIGSSCSPNPCDDPVGACCATDGNCTEVTQSICEVGGGIFQQGLSSCTGLICPVELTPWLDPLPLPKTAVPVSGEAGAAAVYDIAVRETAQQLHSQLSPTKIWAYDDGTGASFPGPTIEASSGAMVKVNWLNDLRELESGEPRIDHVLDVDTACIHGAENEPKIVVHLHGGHVAAEYDGYPEDSWLPGAQEQYEYPNQQQAASLWYHDHALGITRLNVYMGLAGLYTLRDPVEQALDLPAGEFEVPLVIQDRMFKAGGQFHYPSSWQDHFFGDKALVNGRVWPYLQVTAGKYRFRLVNGSGSRVYQLSLEAISGELDITVIGNEGGLLPAPVTGLSTLLMGPGERYDVVVDFEGYAPGSEIILRNAAAAPFPNGSPSLPEIMKFVVTEGAAFTDDLPSSLRPVPPIDRSQSVADRDFVLSKNSNDGCGRQNWLINGLGWDDITEYPELGTVETWRFINDSGVSHPMHMHLVFFQILERQLFTRGAGGEIIPDGEPQPPEAWQAGWKDTVMVHPGEMVRVIARFEDYAGKYAYHCHILEHEDHEMMRQFQTVIPGCTVTGDDESFCDGIDNDCDGVIDEECLIFFDGFE